MDSQFKKGVIEVCVLNELKNEKSYGYKLVQNLSQVFNIGESTIYSMLRKLTNTNYLNLYESSISDGPTRKYYTLTDEGKERLEIINKEWNDFIIKVNGLIGGNQVE
ncbi:PadR family transcriptional regulator [Mycoplasmatota bacterium WC44]